MSGETPEPQTVHIQGLDSAEAFEEARVVTSASWEWLVEGYRAAFSRFTATAGQRDPKARFIPLFETLNWATAILDYARKRGPRIDGEIVRGLRFARNSVHHQWADALEPRDVSFPQVVRAGGGSRIVAPAVVVDWFWRPSGQLPDPPPRHQDPTGEQAYSAHLAGRSARLALDHLDSLLLLFDA